MSYVIVTTNKCDEVIRRMNEIGPDLVTPVEGQKNTFRIDVSGGAAISTVHDMALEKLVKITTVSA